MIIEIIICLAMLLIEIINIGQEKKNAEGCTTDADQMIMYADINVFNNTINSMSHTPFSCKKIYIIKNEIVIARSEVP